MIIKYLFCSRTWRFLKFYLVFIRTMQLKKKFWQEQSFAGLEQGSAGFEQGSANSLGSNRLLPGSWPYGHPPSPNTQWSPTFQSSHGIFSVPWHSQCSPEILRYLPAFVSVLLAFNWKQLSFTGLPSTCPCVDYGWIAEFNPNPDPELKIKPHPHPEPNPMPVPEPEPYPRKAILAFAMQVLDIHETWT